MLMGILIWVVCIGRSDVAHATSSLSIFSSCLRQGQVKQALRVFGYLKKKLNHHFVIDSWEPKFLSGEDTMDKDFTEELGKQYPNAKEEMDLKLPEPLVDEIVLTTFVDSDHTYNKVSRRSILRGKLPYFISHEGREQSKPKHMEQSFAQ
mmetsp:Transcript_1218/g.1855  ORF Transcript_1218/g.1855 Transcript_1218/m.1855 type:complete len:150 (+) Transcript_1218:52-501(+)